MGNELSQGTNNEQAERIIFDNEEFDRQVIIESYGHHPITMIPFIEEDR
jgi:hypothetical protein